jgi:hypothetical protein
MASPRIRNVETTIMVVARQEMATPGVAVPAAPENSKLAAVIPV